MKKISKKGFSMIELLFVMIIVSVLSVIAIPTFSSDSAKMTSMKSDAKNTISVIKNEQSKAAINEYEITDTIAHGDTVSYVSDGFYGNSEIIVSKENKILLTDLRDDCKNGFSIQVSDATKEITTTIDFNSCDDTSINKNEVVYTEEDRILDSLKSDADMFLSQASSIQDYYFANAIAIGNYVTYKDNDDDGFADRALQNGDYLQISEGNVVDIKHYKGGSSDCLVMKSTNTDISKSLWYNSCDDGQVSEVEEEDYWW